MQRFMLDTNMVSYFLKGKSAKLAMRLQHLGFEEHVCLSALTEGEIRFGLAKSPVAAARRQLFEQFLTLVEVRPWAGDEAQVYGELRAQQQAEGGSLNPLDTLIAAHAVAVGAVLVTNDAAFRFVKGLKVENWATDL